MSSRVEPDVRRRFTSGFTLIELLVVLAIIAALAAVVGPSVLRNVSDARHTAAKSQIEIFALALEAYRIDNAAYPTTEQGLEALRTPPAQMASPLAWRGPYLRKSVPMDPWGRPYLYVAPGSVNADSFDLYTLGRDGRNGGTGEDADVTSWGGSVQ